MIITDNKRLQAREWIAQNQDKHISFTVEGGNDSGWGQLMLNGEYADDRDPVIEYLTGRLLEALEYYSFAGEFYVNGELEFDKEKQAFTGYMDESTDVFNTHTVNISLKVPDSLWFDKLLVRINFDSIETSLTVFHGPVSRAHQKAEDKLNISLEKQLEYQLPYLRDKCVSTYEFTREQGIVENGKLVFFLTEVAGEEPEENEKDFEIAIADLLPQNDLTDEN